MPEKVSKGRGTFRMQVINYSTFSLAKMQTCYFGWTCHCRRRGERLQVQISYIVCGSIIRFITDIKVHRDEYLPSLLSTIPMSRFYTQVGKIKCQPDKLFQPDAASLSKGELQWTRAGPKGHSPF